MRWSANEVGKHGLFPLGERDASLDTCLLALQEPGHVLSQYAHYLHSLEVFPYFLRCGTVTMFQYLDEMTGISAMVKNLLSWSNAAVVPALLAETTAAAGFK